MVDLLHLLAQTAAGSTDPFEGIYGHLTELGVAGIGLVGFIAGWIVPRWALRAESARADKAEAQRDSLFESQVKEILPAVIASTAAAAKLVQVADRMERGTR